MRVSGAETGEAAPQAAGIHAEEPAAAARRRTAFETFWTVKRFGSLDGLRCLSILAVLWHHSSIHLDFPLLRRGQLGVHLFFAISGFLITSLMIRERSRHGQVSLRKFYMRRSLRIFPLHYAVLATYVVVVAIMERGTADGREFFANLASYATYTSNWFVDLDSGERLTRVEHHGHVGPWNGASERRAAPQGSTSTC